MTELGAKHDQGKLFFECFMGDLAPVIKGIVMVLTYGANKYKRNSWQSVPNGKQRYLDAFYRHMNAYHSGEVADKESGIAHIFHALCNLMFIAWFEIKEYPHTMTAKDFNKIINEEYEACGLKPPMKKESFKPNIHSAKCQCELCAKSRGM